MPPQNDVAPVAPMHFRDLAVRLFDGIVQCRLDGCQILFESGDPFSEIEYPLDSLEVEALVGEFLDQLQTLDVLL